MEAKSIPLKINHENLNENVMKSDINYAAANKPIHQQTSKQAAWLPTFAGTTQQ